MNLLNKRFKEIRKELGYTQEQYADFFGIKRCNVGSYDEGRATIPLNLIPKLMELGDIPKEDMYDFIFDENYETKN